MIWLWIAFISLILVLLALDLGVFNRKDHVFKMREALGWSAFWIGLGLLFSIVIYFCFQNHWLGIGLGNDPIDSDSIDGRDAVIKYLTGYVIEKSLSVDNIFVIALIFAYLKIPALYQHRVLFWGIVGAILMRGLMIWAGAALIQYHWIIYVFGGFLVFTGIKDGPFSGFNKLTRWKYAVGSVSLAWAFLVERVTGIEPALPAWEI